MHPTPKSLSNFQKLRAFTLIELLVVLMVIGVLGGILFSGATYLFEEQANKQAKAEVEMLQLCLEEYKSDFGTYPITEDLADVSERAVRLLQVLSGTHDEMGEELAAQEIRKSYLPIDKFKSILNEAEEEYLIDPWDEPYQYAFPRLDGHSGYLLFSKGEDKEASSFDGETEGVPEKTPQDFDNIPPSEPGKW